MYITIQPQTPSINCRFVAINILADAAAVGCIHAHGNPKRYIGASETRKLPSDPFWKNPGGALGDTGTLGNILELD